MKKKEGGPKILFYDIETAPNIGAIWGKYEQDVIWFEKDWYILSFSYKWLGDKTATVIALPDFKLYKKEPENDRELVKALWEKLNEADIVVAHYGDAFDNKKSSTRFIQHGLTPPAPYKSVDTKKVAAKYFKFDSNKLMDLGRYLDVGTKMETGGSGLWRKCMLGDSKAWDTMKKYNKQDVELLEQIYLKMLPWITTHPNTNGYKEGVVCPRCGSSHLNSRGNAVLASGTQYKRYQCQDCGAWSRDNKTVPFTRPKVKGI